MLKNTHEPFYSLFFFIGWYSLSSTVSIDLTNKKISNILAAIDGSENSFKAAEYALNLAKTFEAQLYAVTVTYVPASDHLTQKDVLRKSLTEDNNNKMKDAENWFENFTKKAKDNNIQLKTELLNSTKPVGHVLLEFAEEQNIDLIVVGTRGRTGFKKLLLGSVASSIVTYSHCPVLVIK